MKFMLSRKGRRLRVATRKPSNAKNYTIQMTSLSFYRQRWSSADTCETSETSFRELLHAEKKLGSVAEVKKVRNTQLQSSLVHIDASRRRRRPQVPHSIRHQGERMNVGRKGWL